MKVVGLLGRKMKVLALKWHVEFIANGLALNGRGVA
jgi:hypothetical protein